MRRLHAAALLTGLVLAAGPVSGAAQNPVTARPTREQIHPELIDTTWGSRTAAAWKLAFERRWDDARSRFAALQTAYPYSLESINGLAFVARATGHRDDAIAWLAMAQSEEPNESTRKQIEAVEWDRPGSADLSVEAARAGHENTTNWSFSAIVPVEQRLSLTARAGVLGAGDPLRGVLLDSSAGAQARVLSAGAVIRPTETLALTTRAEFWTSGGQHQTFVWLDGTQRVADHLAVRLGARPVGGATGGTQFTGGADFIFVPTQSVSLEIVQGARAAPFEARTQLRAFYFGAPTLHQTIRLGVLRDTGPANQATTGFVALSWFSSPTFGVSIAASKREGAFARSSAGGGFVVRW